MYEEIAKQIKVASYARNKIGMFHYQVLLHAHELLDVDPHEFCREVRVPDSFSTEFSKMLKVAKTMKQQGTEIAKAHG